MKWLVAIFLLFMIDWFYYPVSWEYLLGSKILAVSLALHAGYSESNSFKNKSLFVFLAIVEWLFFIEYLIYLRITHCSLLFALAYLIFIPCFLWIWRREYDIESDIYSHKTVCLLLLKPNKKCGLFQLIRLFFGMPFLSICLVVDNKVYAFRKSTDSFGCSEFNDKWLNSHILIDTQIKYNENTIIELDKLIGTRRYPYIKCIYSIRNVLAKIDKRLRVNNIFEYLPGIYAVKILKFKRRPHGPVPI